MRLWAAELGRFPLSWCLEALDQLYKRQESTRAPTLRRVKETCEEIERYKRGDSRPLTGREKLLVELQKYARVRARYRSPKGQDCEVTMEGLSYRGEEGLWKLLPWGDIPERTLVEMVSGGQLRTRRDAFYQSLHPTELIADPALLPPVPDPGPDDRPRPPPPTPPQLTRRLLTRWTTDNGDGRDGSVQPQ